MNTVRNIVNSNIIQQSTCETTTDYCQLSHAIHNTALMQARNGSWNISKEMKGMKMVEQEQDLE